MTLGTVIGGTSLLGQHDGPPDWTPLRDLVGFELADWFMAMFEIELDDGATVHAYKHYITRRYLFLGEDRRAYAYLGSEPEQYRQITRAAAIEEAFRDWKLLGGGPEDPDSQAAMLAFAAEIANAGQTMPYSAEQAAERDAENREAWAKREADEARDEAA